MGAKFWLVSTVCLLPLVTACQTDPQSRGQPEAVSLQEAKQGTATFERSVFMPPPPNVEDITAILEKEKPDPRVADWARNGANAQPRAGLRGVALASFYYERSLAASKIGRLKQRLFDIHKAVELAEKHGGDLVQYLQEQSFAEEDAGNIRNALQLALRRADVERTARGRLYHGTYARVAIGYMQMGDINKAKDWFGQLVDHNEKTKDRCENSPNPRCGFVPLGTAVRLGMKARLLAAEGKFDEAANLEKEKLPLIEPFIGQGMTGRLSEGTLFDWYNDSIQRMARYKMMEGRLLEAEIDSRKALVNVLNDKGKYTAQAGRHILWLQKVIFEQGRFDDAESLAHEALNIFKTIGTEKNAKTLADARAQLADALVAGAEWKDAIGYFNKIERALQGDALTRRTVLGDNLNLIWARYRTGDVKIGIKGVRGILVQRGKSFGDESYLAAEARGFLAMGLALDRKLTEAFKEFRAATAVLLSSAQESAGDRSKVSARDLRLGAILDAYIDLLGSAEGQDVAKRSGLDAVSEAFQISDFGRSRSVQSALAALGARAAAGNSDLAGLVRDEQDTRKRIDGLFSVLRNALSAPSNQQDANAIVSLKATIDGLRKSQKALTAEIAAKFPTYSDLIAPKPPTPATVQKNLAPGEALIAYYFTDKNAYVWAFPKSGPIAFAAAPLGKESIADMVDELRWALDPGVSVLGEIPDFDVALSHKLYKTLLAPVQSGWKNAKSLLVVNHKALARLPLSVLVTKPTNLPKQSGALFANHRNVPWLARTHTVTALPSVASLVSLRAMPATAKGRRAFVGFGDPYFSAKQAAAAKQSKPVQMAAAARGSVMRAGSLNIRSSPNTRGIGGAGLANLPRLPDTGDEIISVALALKANRNRDVFLGRRATEEAVKEAALSNYKVVYFATHGLVPWDLDGLTQPALALSSPDLTKGTREDGLLTMGEVLSLRLDADWVVLSACNTAAGEDGGEAFSGLGRAFFYAGTRAILLSNWPVETTSARVLTTDLFKRQAEQPTLSRSQALRLAMLALIDGPGYRNPKSNKVVFSYAHPIFWAPFSLLGDGGGDGQLGS